jgi:hypothetical protein
MTTTTDDKYQNQRHKQSVDRWRHRYYQNQYTLNLVLEKFKDEDPELFERVMHELAPDRMFEELKG